MKKQTLFVRLAMIAALCLPVFSAWAAPASAGSPETPGQAVTFQFYNLEVGKPYSIQLQGEAYPIAAIGTAPPGLQLSNNEVRFVAPSEGSYDGGTRVSTSFTVGVILGSHVSVSAQLDDDLALWQVYGTTQRGGGTIGLTGGLPPTCFIAGITPDNSCPKSLYKGMLQTYLYQGQFYCCLQSPF